MTRCSLTHNDCFGFARPAVDAHVLGINALGQLLADCGFRSVIADAPTCTAFNNPESPAGEVLIRKWIRENKITVLGFSYRLDPLDGTAILESLLRSLNRQKYFAAQGGPIRALYFAGLPRACDLVRTRFTEVTGVFCGDETAAETLDKLGINPALLPRSMVKEIKYDDDRLAFAGDILRTGEHLSIAPIVPGGYPQFGSVNDSLAARVHYRIRHDLLPVIRAHVGPYGPDRIQAVRRFEEWTRRLARDGFLDVLSIGTSQLSQSNFGEDWTELPNGGGVPINTEAEYASVWEAARPMLVRTYAGTRHIPELARMYEETIHIAWHALSLWWFCRIDGRGPHSLRENLSEHISTLQWIATTRKPFEPNVPHHFAFRGADDVTYIVSAVLAARLAKRMGIQQLVLQNMLNTPKYTWGVQDLAKSRALLRLVRELQDNRFSVFLQTRGGLDYFSPDLAKAKKQLAAVTALMDDIEPHSSMSPQIIHVVSYSEASHLATPDIVNESIQITLHALEKYRRLRQRGLIDDMSRNADVALRTELLIEETRTVLDAIEKKIPDPYSVDGFYRILAEGYLPIPYLWECRDEFTNALEWQTQMVQGGVRVVDGSGNPISAAARMGTVAARAN